MAPTRADLARVYQVRDPRLAGHQQAEAVVADVDGITVLCSANPAGKAEHTWMLRLAHDGSVRWERRYDSTLGVGRAIATEPAGGFVVAGEVQRSQLEYEAQLMYLDTDCRVLAAASFGPRGATGFSTVTVLHDGSVLLGGTARWKGWLVRATGVRRVVWELLIDDVGEVVAVAAVPANGFAMAAIQEQSTTLLGRTCLAVFAADGRLRWRKELPSTGRAEPAGLAVYPDGGLAAVGHHLEGEQGGAHLWVVRVDPAGDVVWERRFGSADENLRGRAIAPLPGGGAVVAADARRDDGRRVRAVRLAADSTPAWKRAFGGGREYKLARGLARTVDGDLVIVGSATVPVSGKIGAWVLRLDENGRRRWEHVFYHGM